MTTDTDTQNQNTAKMTVSWKSGYNPEQIAARIEETKTVDGSGNVQFRGFEHMEHTAIFYSMLEFPDSIPEIEGRSIANQATFIAGKKGVITAKSLLAEINRLEASYSKRPMMPYVLATSLSLDQRSPLFKTQLSNATIKFEPRLPKHYEKEAAKLSSQAKYSLFADAPNNYLSVRVFVSAKSIYEAANIALFSLTKVA